MDEKHRRFHSGRYGNTDMKRPVAGEQGEPKKPLTGVPGKTDRPKAKPKDTPKKKKMPTVRDAKEAIGKYKQKQKEYLDNI